MQFVIRFGCKQWVGCQAAQLNEWQNPLGMIIIKTTLESIRATATSVMQVGQIVVLTGTFGIVLKFLHAV